MEMALKIVQIQIRTQSQQVNGIILQLLWMTAALPGFVWMGLAILPN
jgi:hypothetical protein